MNSEKLLAKCVLIAGLVLLCSPAQSTTVWTGVYKIVSVIVDLAGNLYIQVNQPLQVGACPITDVFALPKIIPATNVTVSDSVLSRMQAIAQSAKAQNTPVSFGLESNFGCLWGVNPVIVQINETK